MLLRAYEQWADPLRSQWQLSLQGETPAYWDVAYFDPMFNEAPGEALSRRQVRIFSSVVGVEQDAQNVAHQLRGLGKFLIIKRPLKGHALRRLSCMDVIPIRYAKIALDAIFAYLRLKDR